jgi:hypothetical protein
MITPRSCNCTDFSVGAIFHETDTYSSIKLIEKLDSDLASEIGCGLATGHRPLVKPAGSRLWVGKATVGT